MLFDGETNEKSKRAVLWVMFLGQIALFFVLLAVLVRYWHEGSKFTLTLASISLFAILIDILVFSSQQPGRQDSINYQYTRLLAMTSLYLFTDGLFSLLPQDPAFRIWSTINNTVFSLCPMVMIVIFVGLLKRWAGEGNRPGEANRSREGDRTGRTLDKIGIGLCKVFILLTLGNLFGGYFFYVNAEGQYIRGTLYPMSVIITGVLLFLITVRIWITPVSRTDKVFFLAYPLLPFMAYLIMVAKPNIHLLTISVFLAVMIFHLHLVIRREQNLAEQKRDRAESELQLLRTQVNPHFLNNALASLAGLCETDPKGAREMTYLMSDYLQDFYVDLEKPAIIPLREELHQLEHYVAIEKVRFPQVKLHYDLAKTDFEIPAMTLQPLVENAIKHGRSGGKTPLNIYISTGETKEHRVVLVRDDGVGFDPGKIDKGAARKSEKSEPGDGEQGAARGRLHIGIQNVQRRLAILSGGSLVVESAPGEGTCCKIFLPKESGTRGKE